MIAIRKYEKKDRENLFKICVETSSLPVDTQKQLDFLNYMFNDYYAQVEGDNCFVAADDNDEAVGYILCAENYKNYCKTFSALYLPLIRKLGMKYYFMAVVELVMYSFYGKKYPAHLHIDILPVCQGKGTGTALMNELKDHLKEKGINSLMLSCSAENTMAIKFYKKNNFKIVATLAGSCIMACEF